MRYEQRNEEAKGLAELRKKLLEAETERDILKKLWASFPRAVVDISKRFKVTTNSQYNFYWEDSPPFFISLPSKEKRPGEASMFCKRKHVGEF